MEDVRARLAEWQDHGLISFEQAAHIEGREGQRRPATAARADELLCYIGSGLLVFGAFWIAVDLGELFGENNEWKAFFVVAAASVLASLAGGYLLRSMDPAARRGAGWVLGLAVLSGAVALGILLGLIAETGDNHAVAGRIGNGALRLRRVAIPTVGSHAIGPVRRRLAHLDRDSRRGLERPGRRTLLFRLRDV